MTEAADVVMASPNGASTPIVSKRALRDDSKNQQGGSFVQNDIVLAPTPSVTVKSHGTVQPILKRRKFNVQMFKDMKKHQIDAPRKTEELTYAGIGTNCYAILLVDPKGMQKSRKNGATFEVTKTNVLFGCPDPIDSVYFDKKKKAVVFHFPDPDEWEAAKAEKEKSGSNSFIELENKWSQSYSITQSVWIDVDGIHTNGMRAPCIVHLRGLHCRASRSKTDDRIFYNVKAKSMTPLGCTGLNPHLISKYLQQSGAVSNWFHETPVKQEGDPKPNPHHVIIPMVRDDDLEYCAEQFPMCDDEKGFFAWLHYPEYHDLNNYFEKNKEEANKAGGGNKNAGGVGSNQHGSGGKTLTFSNAEADYSIKAKYTFQLTQWDTSLSPAFNKSNAVVYDGDLTAHNKSLWGFGASHGSQWYILSQYLPFMGGSLICQENYSKTKDLECNVDRDILINSFEDSDPRKLGIGLPQSCKPHIVMFSKGIIPDMISFLRNNALRCSFMTVLELFRLDPESYKKEMEKTDPKSRRKPFYVFGKCGYTRPVIKEGNTRVLGEKVPLVFQPEGFICLNAINGRVDLVNIKERVEDTYFVLPMLSPDPATMENMDAQAALIPKIKDEQVLDICFKACGSAKGKMEMQNLALQGENPSESVVATSQWLQHYRYFATSFSDEDPPYLVFAIEKQSDNPKIIAQKEKDFQLAVKGWTVGPNRAMVSALIQMKQKDKVEDVEMEKKEAEEGEEEEEEEKKKVKIVEKKEKEKKKKKKKKKKMMMMKNESRMLLT